MPSALIPLCVDLKHCFGTCTGINFLDATKIQVCHNRRIGSHRVFENLAALGKTSVDWFFGFKLHLVVNDLGELLNVRVTPGNVDDRKPVCLLLQSLFGKIFADKGYISQSLTEQLHLDFGIEFFAKLRKNMKNYLMRLHDKLQSRKRSIVETLIDQLKNISQTLAFSRQRARNQFRALSATPPQSYQFLCQCSVWLNRLLPST